MAMTVPENRVFARNMDFSLEFRWKNDLQRGLQEIHKIESHDRTASDKIIPVIVLEMGSHYPICSRLGEIKMPKI